MIGTYQSAYGSENRWNKWELQLPGYKLIYAKNTGFSVLN